MNPSVSEILGSERANSVSYDLCFWSSQVPILPGDAERIYLQLCENGTEILEPRANAEINLQKFREALTSRYHELSSFFENDIDRCVWSCDFDVSMAHIIVCISYSRTSEVVPYALQIAFESELVAYDPQKNLVINPQSSSEAY